MNRMGRISHISRIARVLSLIFVSLFFVSLMGCAKEEEKETFGVRDSVWKTLTPQQQNLIIRSHTKMHERSYEESEKYRRNPSERN